MREAWNRLSECIPRETQNWLENMLRRNEGCAYLQQYGAVKTIRAFRHQIPLVSYTEIEPWIQRIAQGEKDILFDGLPVGFELTGGSDSGKKLIPYTKEGLQDFRYALLSWLNQLAQQFYLSGSIYFSLSPACRSPESLSGIPLGLSDLDYFGTQAAQVISELLAVPHDVGVIKDITEWKRQTLYYLRKTKDLQLISAWSPTFLISLFDGIDTHQFWPELKVISCWADAGSAQFIPKLQAMFPNVYIEPKGLLSTEAVITIPNNDGQSVLVNVGLIEFRQGENIYLAEEMIFNEVYEVIVTTSNGLYRYCTGDQVRYDGLDSDGKTILKFLGRNSLTSDLVGEKLTEDFVAGCCRDVDGFHMLIPNSRRNGYALVTEKPIGFSQLAHIEKKLCRNPQYAYARRMGQLVGLIELVQTKAWCYYEKHMQKKGQRLGDIKPVSLRPELFWIQVFEEKII